MQTRKFDELISYFNRKVSEMSIDTKYKMELLGMVTALGLAHEKELTAQPEPCEDAVSREAVVDVFYELWGTSLTRTVNAINDLPTVTPKQQTGKWIKKNGNLYCSKCGTKALFRMDKKILDYDYCESNFCPNCGMNMRGK